jgi:glycosyltransferase involved in cell wall biosynthesis
MRHLSEKMVQDCGDEVTVATSNSMYGPELKIFKEIEPAVEQINGVEVHRFKFNRWHYPIIDFAKKVSGKLFHIGLPHSIWKYRNEMDANGIDLMMKNSSADVIMATTINYMFSDYPLWRNKTKNPKPFVLYGALHLHINWSSNSPMFKRAKACDCYIANTEYERQKLIEYGVDASKAVTIGTGIAIEDMQCNNEEVRAFRKKNNISDEDILIGHIGRLSQGKGAGILLDAFNQAYKKKKNIKLLLAGTTTAYSTTLKDNIKEYNIPVVLMEDFQESLKPILFNALDIFVLASKGESFGVVFLEAWACKKPVIGVNMGAVATLLADDYDSCLFEPDSVESLCDKICLLVDDNEKRIQFAERGLQKINEHYTWPKIVAKYRSAYELGIKNFKEQSLSV